VLHRKHVTRRITPQQVAKLQFVPRTPALAALSVMKEKVPDNTRVGSMGIRRFRDIYRAAVY